MKLPRLSHSGVAYRDKYQSIQKIEADFGRFSKTYYLHDHGDRVGIIVLQQSKMLLVKQYRLLVNGPSLEIPGGKIEPGESPKLSAIRECLEETGIRCKSARRLIRYMPGMDVYLNPTEIFVASATGRRITPRPRSGEQEVVLGAVWLPVSKVVKMIFAGQIQCGLTILGTLAYVQKHPPI
jgi:8-oxo-dGTP pyrophosphatase MutT (NUDIX family)